MQGFDVARAAERLAAQGGGYEVVHESPGLEIGVYVLVAPEPDGQTPHAFDEVYVVLDGEGDVEVEERRRHVSEETQSSSPPEPTIASPATSTSLCWSSSTARTPHRSRPEQYTTTGVPASTKR